MRRLFIPACVCLVAWSAPLGPESPLPRDIVAGGPHGSGNPPPNSSDTRFDIATSWGVDAPAPGQAPRLPDQGSVQTASIAPETVPTPIAPPPKPVVHRSQREICDALAEAAHSNNLPVPFFIRVLFQESKFEPATVSSAGAQGIAQFMPETAADVGLDNPFDPLQAIPAAARLLRDLANRFGNLGLAAAAYNAGPTRLHNWLDAKAELPAETVGYVQAVTGQPVQNWKTAPIEHGGNRLPQRAPCKDVSGLYAWVGKKRIPLPPRPPAMLIAMRQAPTTTASADTGKKTAAAETKKAASAETKKPVAIRD